MNKCPRCGNNFNCAASEISACFCSAVNLSVDALQQLKQSYTNCLCPYCLNHFVESSLSITKHAN